MKIIIKPVRRCKDCGHLVPLQRVNCPYCNGEKLEFGDHSEKDVPLETTDYSFLKKYKWVALGGILALVVLVIFISALSGGKEDTNSSPQIATETTPPSQEVVAQHMKWKGNFIIRGRSYPVRLEFDEKGEEITNCVYTNVSQGGIKMTMTGAREGDSYTFDGHDGANPLVISVSETYSGHYEGQASGQFEAKAVFDREYDASEARNVETFEGYHTFSGHNGAKVRGEITVNGTEVTGRERYSSSYLPLSGYYDPESGRMEMTEYNNIYNFIVLLYWLIT